MIFYKLKSQILSEAEKIMARLEALTGSGVTGVGLAFCSKRMHFGFGTWVRKYRYVQGIEKLLRAHVKSRWRERETAPARQATGTGATWAIARNSGLEAISSS
ncbi:hypothetical protein BH24DEI2_BH24DEI2_06640 [soil metagenome]